MWEATHLSSRCPPLAIKDLQVLSIVVQCACSIWHALLDQKSLFNYVYCKHAVAARIKGSDQAVGMFAQVVEAFKILTSDPQVKAIMVNIFGVHPPIAHCAVV